MTQPTDKSGDSTPNFGWVHDPGQEPSGLANLPAGGDSATTLWPPADEAVPITDEAATMMEASATGAAPEEGPLEATVPLFELPAAGEAAELIDEGEAYHAPVGSPAPQPSYAETALAPAPPLTAAPDRRVSPKRSAFLLIVLISYASAVTIALVCLYARQRNPNPHVLESLPDVAPLRKGEVQIVPVDAPMPIGHTLRLGESQRFGNVRVEPLRVVREPAGFAHFSGQSRQPRESTEPILKLWLRFTNVAADQAIAPLDPHLVFARRFDRDGKAEAKNFVCRAADKDRRGPVVFLYDHPETSEWDFVGQQLGRVLQPGESFDTYVPSAEEGLDQLAGEMLWRVHFRKVYSPR
jgi:hypothetical protein